jgi:hypothetical protein
MVPVLKFRQELILSLLQAIVNVLIPSPSIK